MKYLAILNVLVLNTVPCLLVFFSAESKLSLSRRGGIFRQPATIILIRLMGT